jgi:hypothetical protein
MEQRLAIIQARAGFSCRVDPTAQQGPYRTKLHIPPDLVVDQWASDGESSSQRPSLFQYDVWTMFCRHIREK